MESSKLSKDEVKIYKWGRAVNELSDNPFFEDIKNMLEEIIKSLETSVCDQDPIEGIDYGALIARRTGQVTGLKNFRTLMMTYKNFYLKNINRSKGED